MRKLRNVVYLSSCLVKNEYIFYGRAVDPYTLVLKGHNWYLYGYCRLRQEFRLFKVSRMKDIEMQNDNYQRVDINLEEMPWDREWHSPKNTTNLVLRFDENVRAVVEEWFGIENVQPGDSGSFIVKTSFPEDDWLYGFILSFGVVWRSSSQRM